jgi:hypothetical protein
VKQDAARVPTTCPNGSPGGCIGTLKLKGKDGASFGVVHVSLSPAQRRKLRVPLSKAAHQRLAKASSVKATATVISHDRFGTRKTRTSDLKLFRPKAIRR